MAFNFGGAATATTAPGGFGFGAPTTPAAPAGFGFGAPPAAPAAGGFGFGTPTTATAPTPAAPTTGFGFGAPAVAPTTGGFGFGAPTAPATAPAAGGFGFGAPAAGGFGFGAPAAAPVPATTAQPATQPQAQQPEPPIRLEQTLSTLTPTQQKKIAFLDEMIRGQGTYNEYLSNQLQALYSSYPLFFQSNDINPPIDTVHGKGGGLGKSHSASQSTLGGGGDKGYISPKQLLQVLSSLYLSITTDATALKELDQELAAEENNIDGAARQLSILLNDPTYLSNYNTANNNVAPTTTPQSVGGFGMPPQQPKPNNTGLNDPHVQHLSQFQQSSELITVPSYYHWNKLQSFQQRLVQLQTSIHSISESLSTLGLLDTNSVDVSTLVLVLTETLQNQSMSLLSAAVSVSNMSKKVKMYKEQTERVLRHRGADQYTLNLLSAHRKKITDSAKIPLTKPTTNNSSLNSNIAPEKTLLIPTGVVPTTTTAAAVAPQPATGAPAPPATTGFSFGAPTAPATTGFGFGQPTAASAPATAGFGFGAPATAPTAPATQAGGFPVPAQPPALGSGAGGFSFTAQPGAPAAAPGLGASTSSSTTSRPGVKRRR